MYYTVYTTQYNTHFTILDYLYPIVSTGHHKVSN